MTGPSNAIMGDDFGIDLPHMEAPEQDLTEEKNMAKFSKTKEFQKLKEHFESRIAFYQGYLPDGRDIKQALPTGEEWVIANAIIGEFKAVLGAYEQAREVVDEVVRRKGA